MDREKAIQMIQRLIRLQDSPNEHEAAAAAAKATELLTKYNLSMAEVDEGWSTEMMETAMQHTFARGDEWRITLVLAISGHTFTKAFFRKEVTQSDRTGKRGIFMRPHFYGRRDNAEVAAYLGDQLYQRLLDLSKEATSRYVDKLKQEHHIHAFHTPGLGSHHPNTYRNSWLRGAARGIHATLQASRQKADNASQALILLRDEEVEEAWRQYSNNMRTSNSEFHNRTNVKAFQEGYEKGAGLSFNPGLPE